MGNFGFLEMGAVLVIALLVFGPDRLPEVARNVGKLLGRFREETTRSLDELKRAAAVDGLDSEIKGIRDEFGRIRSEVRGFTSDVTRSVEKGARAAAKPTAPPPFDPDAT